MAIAKDPIDHEVNRYLKAILNRNRIEAQSIIRNLMISNSRHDLAPYDVLAMAQDRLGEMRAEGIANLDDETYSIEVAEDTLQLMSRKKTRETRGRALAANCVEGEFHTLGLELFAQVLRQSGWDVELELENIHVSVLLDWLRKKPKFDLLCISVSMPVNIPELMNTLRLLRNNNLTNDSTIIVGGKIFESKRIQQSVLIDSDNRLLADFATSDMHSGSEWVNQLFEKVSEARPVISYVRGI